MAETWETDDNNSYIVEVGTTQRTVEDEVTAEDVKNTASDEGVKKFKVEDSTGAELNQADFPVQDDVRVREYNENA